LRRIEIACKNEQNDALTAAVLVLNAEKSDDIFCAWATIWKGKMMQNAVRPIIF